MFLASFNVKRFKVSHRQFFYVKHLLAVNCIQTTKIKKKSPGVAHLKLFSFLLNGEAFHVP